MPPKPIVSREDIIEAAIRLLREQGGQSLNARSIAAALGCSTKPLFRVYDSMDTLKADVIQAVSDDYDAYFDQRMKRTDIPAYKASGLAYIQFARDEPELFKLLFMRDRTSAQMEETDHSYDTAVNLIMASTGFDHNTAVKLHLEMWIFVHGIATLLVTSFLDISDALIGEMMTDVYLSVQARYRQEMKQHERNQTD